MSTTLELHHLVGSAEGVEYHVEEHHITLFSDDEYRDAFERAGLPLEVVVSPHPDRDRYVGTLPLQLDKTDGARWRRSRSRELLDGHLARSTSASSRRGTAGITVDAPLTTGIRAPRELRRWA